jgi:cell pole-organizing protein PopZ
MDEILNSIRRIVAEDAKHRGKRSDPLRQAPVGDRAAVLDLTEVVTADGTIFSIADQA